jgi:hypothetical protein
VFKNIVGVVVGAVAVLVMLCASNARAASISWGTPNVVDINDPTQVLTNGTLVYAGFRPSYYYTDSPADTEIVVNGVAFTQDLLNNTDVGGGSWSGPYGPASNAYSELLADGLFNQDLGTHTTTITGLTVGDNYEIQVFTSFWGGDSGFETQLISGSNVVDMGNNASTPTYDVGTFTADSTSQSFQWTGVTDYGVMAAVQVREVAVPEPATAGLLLLGVPALLLRRPRRS